MHTQVYIHLFIGPTAAARNRYDTASACDQKQGVKPGNASIHGIKRITGRTIAYAAVQGSARIPHLLLSR